MKPLSAVAMLQDRLSNGRPADIPLHLRSDSSVLGFKERCRTLITEHSYRRVCEIGGGRAPLFTPSEIAALRLDYTVMDISAEELAHVPPGIATVCRDICALPSAPGSFDFMFSRMVAEHVRDGAQMHQNVFELLSPGGRAFHLLPTLYNPAFVLNRLIPPRLSRLLLKALAPRSEPKFPARYSRCQGPTPGMLRLLRSIGYEIDEYRPFYGTAYFQRVPVLGALDRRLNEWAARHRNPYFTSYAWLIVHKPAGSAGAAPQPGVGRNEGRRRPDGLDRRRGTV